MKRFILAFALVFCIAVLPAVAQSQEGTSHIWDHGNNVSDLSYRNVTIYKIYDQSENYIVLYEKEGIKIGQVNIPKEWVKVQLEGSKKLEMRSLDASLDPYMTVYYRGGEFYKIVLNLPNTRLSSVWGVAPSTLKVSTNVDSFSIEY